MKSTFTIFLFFFLLALSPSVRAQLNYLPGGFSTSAGTYVDLGLNGDTIPLPNKDDAFSAPLPIGFTFNFNGALYDSFVFNTNGFIKLGRDSASRHFLFTTMAQPPANGPFTPGTTPAPLLSDTSMLFAFGQDLYPGTMAAEYRFYTDGAPGSRILTVQWKNVRDKLQAATGTLWDTINFQLKLYEGSNVVEYVYGKWTSTISLALARFAAVGIVGNAMTTTNQNIHLVKGSTVAWNAAVANTGFYLNNAVNYRNPTSSPAGPAPDVGRAYRFTPITLNDASVNLIYAQGRVTLTHSSFDSIRANIVNPGVNPLTNLTVTLTISGAHSYTTTSVIPSIISGGSANVAFAPFTPSFTGASVITVSVPNDDNLANNEKVYSYNVGDYRMTYGDTLIPHTGSNGTTIGNFWGARYFIAGSAVVTTVHSFLVSNSDALGDTLAGLILDTLGNVIARSASRIVQASDLGTLLTFNMLVPVTMSNRSVIAGIAGGNTVSGLNYFLGTSQTETPIRPNSPFFFMSQIGTVGITNLTVGTLYSSPVGWGTTRLMMECEVRPLPQIDAIISAAAPVNNSKVPVNTPIPFTAIVKNNGQGILASGIPVRYRIGTGPIIGPVNTATILNASDTTSVTFSGANALTFATAGTYTVKVFSGVLNDSIPGNDTLILTYVAQAPTTLPYRIDNNMLTSWTAEASTPTIWKNGFATQPNGVSNGTVLWADNNVVPAGRMSKVISPFFSFIGVAKPTFHFHVAHAANVFPGSEDTLEVLVSTDGGYSFTTVWMKSSSATTYALATDTATSFSYSPVNAAGWRHEMIDLSAYSGNSLVQIAFRDRSTNGNGIYIANVSITNPASTSTMPVYAVTSYTHANVTVSLSSLIGQLGADMTFSKYTGAPLSTASPVFANNSTATTNNNGIFTPNRVSQTEWYTITYAGTNPFNPASSVPYTVSIDASAIPGITYPDSVYIMQRASYNAPWVPVNTVFGSPAYISGTITGFSDFALGSLSSANQLPVTLLRLQGKNIGSTQNLLSWSTATEINNSHFVIERSFDKINFREAGTVKGHGNSKSTRQYSYTDEWKSGFRTDVYYRLKQVDLNGSETYSPVVVVAIGARTEADITNPFEHAPQLSVQLSNAAAIQVMITDVSGKSISNNSYDLNSGQTQLMLNEFETLQSGIYFVRLKIGEGEWMVKKVVKK